MEYTCYLCRRYGVRAFHIVRWGKWTGHHRCNSETACAMRIYRAHRSDQYG